LPTDEAITARPAMNHARATSMWCVLSNQKHETCVRKNRHEAQAVIRYPVGH
jgi:hypothetical protein